MTSTLILTQSSRFLKIVMNPNIVSRMFSRSWSICYKAHGSYIMSDTGSSRCVKSRLRPGQFCGIKCRECHRRLMRAVVAGMPLVLLLFVTSAAAQTTYIPGNGWQVFSWNDPLAHQDFGRERNVEGQFTFNVYSGQDAVLTVADAGWNIERIEVYNYSNLMGKTSDMINPGGQWTSSYDVAASSNWSSRSWPLSEGTYKLSFRLTNWGSANPDVIPTKTYYAAFKVDIVQTPDGDGDRIADQFETGTGIYISPVNTGTDPEKADSDGDTLDDWTEITKHLTDPNKADSDGDGFPDATEIAAGKSPTNSAETPDALMELRTAVELTFYSQIGATYQIESSIDLQTWTPQSELIRGDGSIVTRLISIRGQANRYYRVSKLPSQ